MTHISPMPGVPRGVARLWRWPVALLVGLALSLGCITRSPAATTWTVCASGCDYTSIKAAIAAPTTVDGDTVAIAAGVYTEPGITVNKSLTLKGAGVSSTIVQGAASRGTAPDRVFYIPRSVIVTLQALTIRYGHLENGFGGGLSNDGVLTITQSTIRGNTAPYGGGLFNSGYGQLTLTTSTISSNTASILGGGVYNWGTLTLTHSTVNGNTATYNGGGFFNNQATLTITHSTISGNTASPNNATAPYAGGGLYNGGTLALTHSTVSRNRAPYGGGLFNWTSGQSTFTNSIIASNLHGGDCYPDYQGSVTSVGSNLDSDGSCRLTASTDRPGVNPLLGPLQNNGGPTSTHALLPGSPAIDAIPWGTNGCGTTLYSDQRWRARPEAAGGACDIGAFEVEAAGQALGAWGTGVTPNYVTCTNVSTGQVVTLNQQAAPWDCEAAGLGVTAGDQVALHVRGPVTPGATDVGGAVVGLAPQGGGCTNLTTGQAVPFQALFQGARGATAASCVAAGLVVHPRDSVQMRVQGVAE
jgi:hypothetical protein